MSLSLNSRHVHYTHRETHSNTDETQWKVSKQICTGDVSVSCWLVVNWTWHHCMTCKWTSVHITHGIEILKCTNHGRIMAAVIQTVTQKLHHLLTIHTWTPTQQQQLLLLLQIIKPTSKDLSCLYVLHSIKQATQTQSPREYYLCNSMMRQCTVKQWPHNKTVQLIASLNCLFCALCEIIH